MLPRLGGWAYVVEAFLIYGHHHEFIVSLKRPSFIIATPAVPLLGIVGLVVSAYFGGQAGAFLEKQFEGSPKAVGYVDQVGIFTPPLPEYGTLRSQR